MDLETKKKAKWLASLKVGDRVVRYLDRGVVDKEALKLMTVVKVTPKFIYLDDGKRYPRTYDKPGDDTVFEKDGFSRRSIVVESDMNEYGKKEIRKLMG